MRVDEAFIKGILLSAFLQWPVDNGKDAVILQFTSAGRVCVRQLKTPTDPRLQPDPRLQKLQHDWWKQTN